MISRDEAFRIAEDAARAKGIGPRVWNICPFEELPVARPRLCGVDLDHRWIAYIEQPNIGFQSSPIVAVHRDTGAGDTLVRPTMRASMDEDRPTSPSASSLFRERVT